MSQSLKFHLTKHFELRLFERGLSLENVKNVVRYPTSKKQLQRGKNGGMLYRFQKTVEGTTLVVFAELKLSNCWIVTAYNHGT